MSMTSYGGTRPAFGATGSNIKSKVSGYQQAQVSRLSPEQQQLFSMLMGGSMPGIQQGLGHLSQLAAGGTPEYWQQLEAPAMRQLGELQGGIASRFSGMGTGARRSSGHALAQGSLAEDFAEKLQSQRLGLQNQAIQDLLGIGRDLLGRDSIENIMVPKKKPFWQELLMGSSPGIGQGVGMGGSLAILKKLGLV